MGEEKAVVEPGVALVAVGDANAALVKNCCKDALCCAFCPCALAVV